MSTPRLVLALAVCAPALVHATSPEPGACACDGVRSPKAFARCVRNALRRLDRDARRSEAVRQVRRLSARAACGATTAPRKRPACCLPLSPGQGIVTERMCAAVRAEACAALGGVVLGDGIACGPNPCRRLAADIPVGHTPPGGYGDAFPAPILAECTEPLVEGAPDLRGMWQVASVEAGGVSAPPDHPAFRHVERVEQCGDRLVVTSAGVIHDMRCDGTEEHGVHDVAAIDFTTPVTVVATYEDGVHTLRPVGIPGLAITRRLDGDTLVWSYVSFTARLRRIGGSDSTPPPGS